VSIFRNRSQLDCAGTCLRMAGHDAKNRPPEERGKHVTKQAATAVIRQNREFGLCIQLRQKPVQSSRFTINLRQSVGHTGVQNIPEESIRSSNHRAGFIRNSLQRKLRATDRCECGVATAPRWARACSDSLKRTRAGRGIDVNRGE